jgi:hypothetical protein
MVAKTKILIDIAFLMVASWAILFVSAFLVFEVVVPISAPSGSDYLTELVYAALKAVLGASIFGIWFYSFYILRDVFVRITGLDGTPSPSSSHRRPGENRTA